jgi:hypothetical protein
MLAGALILSVLGAVRHEGLYLAFAVFLLAWGGLWMWGASRGHRGDARASAAPPYHRPAAGEVVVLGRAKWRERRSLAPRRAGVLLAGEGDLLWVAGDLSRLGRIGQSLPLGALAASGGAGPGGGPKTVAALDDLQSYRIMAGAFGADTLTLRLRSGGVVRLRLLDPEALVLLGEVFAALAEDGEGVR